jgi:hypothetical protein
MCKRKGGAFAARLPVEKTAKRARRKLLKMAIDFRRLFDTFTAPWKQVLDEDVFAEEQFG